MWSNSENRVCSYLSGCLTTLLGPPARCHRVLMLVEGHTVTLRNWIANKNCTKLRDAVFSQVSGGRKFGSQVGLILCSLVFLIFSLMLVTEINFLFWIGICFPIDMHSFLVAISKGWCSNITVFVKKIFPRICSGRASYFPLI